MPVDKGMAVQAFPTKPVLAYAADSRRRNGRSSPQQRSQRRQGQAARCQQSADAVQDLERRQALLLLATTAASCWSQDVCAKSELPTERQLTPEERAAVNRAMDKFATKSKAPVLLRLVFHDAGTFLQAAGDGGANASVRLELSRAENKGLNRGWGVVEAIKKDLQGTPAAWLSYADIVALAGAHAVRSTGGPDIEVPVEQDAGTMLLLTPFAFDTAALTRLLSEGRLDATAQDPTGRLPEETLTAAQLRDVFARKGMSTQEFIALSGAHTLGSKGFGDPLIFDNTYYATLLKRPWTNSSDSMASMIGLPSDHVLPDDPACMDVIQCYARSQSAFFRDFSASYLKLTSLGAKWT